MGDRPTAWFLVYRRRTIFRDLEKWTSAILTHVSHAIQRKTAVARLKGLFYTSDRQHELHRTHHAFVQKHHP